MPHISQFKAAWWLPNSHLQTMAAKFLRRKTTCITTNETIELPDGDFVDIAWTQMAEENNTLPIVVILHGLEGSKQSHYAKGILNACKENGWIGVLLHFRGCSGRPNRQATSYHSGDTRDITYLTQYLQKKYQHCLFTIIGFSLGGNVLTRYLAEIPNNPYTAAAVICAPLHLSSCSQRINKGFSRLYQKYLVDMLLNSTKIKISLNLISNVCSKKLAEIKTIWQFDQYVTAPLNGYSDAEDYYAKASGRPVLNEIKQPCLFLHAKDDPFLEHDEITAFSQLPANVRFEISNKGGHVGYISGNNPFKPQYWIEQRVAEFFRQFIG